MLKHQRAQNAPPMFLQMTSCTGSHFATRLRNPSCNRSPFANPPRNPSCSRGYFARSSTLMYRRARPLGAGSRRYGKKKRGQGRGPRSHGDMRVDISVRIFPQFPCTGSAHPRRMLRKRSMRHTTTEAQTPWGGKREICCPHPWPGRAQAPWDHEKGYFWPRPCPTSSRPHPPCAATPHNASQQ